jgi:hypothetical protein
MDAIKDLLPSSDRAYIIKDLINGIIMWTDLKELASSLMPDLLASIEAGF